jgi:hypothetical protein
VNLPLQSLGDFGSPSLELCAEEGDWFTLGSIPTAPIYSASRGPDSDLTGNSVNPFGPFGVLPMLDPPEPDNMIDQTVPNIWQLTGLTQPNLANPSMPWDRVHNPYLFPKTDDAETCAKTFATNWQSVADGVNGALAGLTGTPWPIGNPPPGWQWAIPWTWPHGPAGYPYATWGAFQNGIQPELIGQDGTLNLPPEIFTPATVWTLDVDQLDPETWDTRPCESQELGRVMPIFGPPITWASETPPPPS